MANKKAKIERNKFGFPVGMQLDSKGEARLRILRQKAAAKRLTDEDIEEAYKANVEAYPDKDVKVKPVTEKIPAIPEGDDAK
ncbi:MAG: hypothetical protein CMI54_06290 [Parcubacteria group bacterium]|jgi:hypothetical protein|nr:hypothetical protein [Parcubacteria group bacterium]|tara:strand:- start:11091 stop:11336 length:246 start_codon:yes stop_codon:yes gene_type:complete